MPLGKALLPEKQLLTFPVMPPEESRCARRYVCTHMYTDARVSALPEVGDSHDRVGTLKNQKARGG